MARHILRCNKCKKFTLKSCCSECSLETVRVIPPKFSPLDSYGKYRREVKREQFKEEGLL